MFETELKFQVPPARWAALQKAVATASAQRTRLQAIYLETPGHDLAAAGLALRLRKEGRVWVQTLKGRGDGLMQRLEHEVRLGPQRGLPAVDPALHDGTPAGQALRAVLAKARDEGRSADLRMLYRTDIVRLHRRLRHGGAVVEVALDSGAIYAEAADADADAAEGSRARPALRTPVAEIEFELISGPPAALAALAGRWVQRFDLWWDVRTKSERGFRLALARAEVPATRAQPVQWPPGDALATALAAMLQSALSQALPNLAELAGAAKLPAMAAPTPAAADHLHQLRVALRRLRTALVLYGGWAPDPAVPAALQERWQAVFVELGAARDADVLAAVWLPRLQAAGAPALPPDTGQATLDVGERLRRADISVLLMDTLGLCLQLAAPEPASLSVNGEADAGPVDAGVRAAKSRKDAAHAVLHKAWRRAWADARKFATAPVAQRHRARKRLKQLRYAAEFAEPVLPSKPAKRWRRVMTQALQALGDYNDLQIAREHYARLAEQHPQAWYAVGWLAAQVPSASEAAGQAIKALKSQPRPWRKP